MQCRSRTARVGGPDSSEYLGVTGFVPRGDNVLGRRLTRYVVRWGPVVVLFRSSRRRARSSSKSLMSLIVMSKSSIIGAPITRREAIRRAVVFSTGAWAAGRHGRAAGRGAADGVREGGHSPARSGRLRHEGQRRSVGGRQTDGDVCQVARQAADRRAGDGRQFLSHDHAQPVRD